LCGHGWQEQSFVVWCWPPQAEAAGVLAPACACPAAWPLSTAL
jgi:hypothetical protein